MTKENEKTLNWWDNFVGFFSPQSKLKRARFRVAAGVLERKFEGATIGRRTQNWLTGSTDANAETLGALGTLRNRSRDLRRNNPYAARGVQAITSNTIGHGIRAELKASTSRQQTKLQETWRAWTETTAIDFDGRHNLSGLQKIVMDTIVESGEVLIRRRQVGPQQAISPEGNLVDVPPIKLQILEPDYLSSLAQTISSGNGNEIIQGIEFDASGQRVAYHLFTAHPGSSKTTTNSIRVPADEILHVYRMDRPGQVRGVPWLAPVMIRLRDLDEFEDAQLVRQKIAAMFTAFVHDIEGLDADATSSELGEKMEPGLIEILPPGKDVTLANPPGVTNYKEYISVCLHAVSAGLGVTYESLTNDFSEVNFSSARMGQLSFNKNVDAWRWHMLVPQFLNPTFGWFLDATQLLGQRTDGTKVVWTPPRRDMVDPTKEVPAKISAIRAGIETLSDAIRQQGSDPESHLMEIKRDNDLLDKLELTLTSDPRKTQIQPGLD